MSPPETPHSENLGQIPGLSNLGLEKIWKEIGDLTEIQAAGACEGFIWTQARPILPWFLARSAMVAIPQVIVCHTNSTAISG